MRFSVVVVPSAASQQFRIFCELNKAIFPLFYQSGIGEGTAGHLNGESDIRYEELVYGQFALRSFRSNDEELVIYLEVGATTEFRASIRKFVRIFC